MFPRKFISAALVAGSMFVASAASALPILSVDFSPTATNNGEGAVGTTGDFSAVGFQSDMSSVLTINGTSGSGVTYNETGHVNITSFKDSANNTIAGSGVNDDYTLGATFSLAGTGSWSSMTFTSDPNPAFNINLYANGGVDDPSTGTLIGTATLNPAEFQLAFAVVLGSLTDGSSGNAFTSLSATLFFDPVPNYTGPDGFFQNLAPNGEFEMQFAIGNAGGNSTNTIYSVNGTTVTVTNPAPGTNEGTANATFVSAVAVPEPGSLALAGLALLGAAVAGRRKAKARLAV